MLFCMQRMSAYVVDIKTKFLGLKKITVKLMYVLNAMAPSLTYTQSISIEVMPMIKVFLLSLIISIGSLVSYAVIEDPLRTSDWKLLC